MPRMNRDEFEDLYGSVRDEGILPEELGYDDDDSDEDDDEDDWDDWDDYDEDDEDDEDEEEY